MVRLKFKTRVIFIALVLLSFSCTNNEKAYRVSLQETPITATNAALFQQRSVYFENGKTFLSLLKGRQIVTVSCKKDSITSVKNLPNHILKISYFKMFSDSEFVVFSDSTIHLFYNRKWHDADFKTLGKRILPLHRNGVLFFQNSHKLVFTYIKHGKGVKYGKLPYKTTFLMSYDFESKDVKRYNLKYPNLYWDGGFGIPKIFLSQISNKCIVSFSLDPKIYEVDIAAGSFEAIELKGHQVKVNDIPKINKTNKKERLDFISFIESRLNQYGFAYKTPKGDYYRLLNPGKPERNTQGLFFTKYEKGYEIIYRNKQENTTINFVLPSGFFYVSKDWFFNQNTQAFIYCKFHQINPYELQPSIVSVRPFSFELY